MSCPPFNRPAPDVGPYPAPDDRDGWAAWWHRWAEIGRTAASLDPHAPVYTPEYVGDHMLPDPAPQKGEPA
jgi:hypothetical protein